MEQIALVVRIIKVVIAGCVLYSAYSLVVWVLSLFGGVCIGC